MNDAPKMVYRSTKNKATALLQVAKVPMPKMPATRNDGFIHSVRDINSPVKPKFNDVTETQQFKRWFGDWQKHPNTASKVVNKDGTPKVVYHQTDTDFTVFNTNNERAGRFDTETPTGMFFKTSNSDIGISGSKQMAVYLSAKNILEFANRDEAHKYWMKNIPGYKDLQQKYDGIDTHYEKMYDEKEAETDAWYDEHYDDYVAGNISEEEVLKAIDEPLDNILTEWKKKQEPVARKMKGLITDYFKNSQYDGMHLKYDGTRNGVDVDTYIVFEPTQIKSATDNIGTFDGSNPDIRYSDRTSIKEGMTDEERYEILKTKNISLVAKTDTEKMTNAEAKYKVSESYSIKEKDRKKLFKKLGEEFGVFKEYENKDVELSFVFSKGNMAESENKQKGNWDLFAKMFTCFDAVIDSAVGIEIHNRNKEGYKPDPTLKGVYVLASAFEDGESIVPVKLEIKEFSDKNNSLYVAIALESIKKDEVVKEGDTINGVTQASRSSTISLAQLFRNINPSA